MMKRNGDGANCSLRKHAQREYKMLRIQIAPSYDIVVDVDDDYYGFDLASRCGYSFSGLIHVGLCMIR